MGFSLGLGFSLGIRFSLGLGFSLGFRFSLGIGFSLGFRFSLGIGFSLKIEFSLGFRFSFGFKCWDSNSIGEEGGCQGGIGVNSDGLLQRWARGASTLDLVVMEFQMGCGQMDLASACVLRPLNHLVLDFKAGGVMG